MKRLHGVVLLFAGLLIFGLISNGTWARDIALTTAGFLTAIVIALAVTGSLCFLMQCAASRTIVTALPRLSPTTWTGVLSTKGRLGRTHAGPPDTRKKP